MEGLDESIFDNMRVYLVQHFRAPLTELTRHVDTLITITDRKVRASKQSNYRPLRSAIQSNRLYAHTVILSDDDGQKKYVENPTEIVRTSL